MWTALPKVVALLALAAVSSLACAAPNRGPDAPNTVHMNNTRFAQASVTIRPGESLNLVADTNAPHIIGNGSWAGGRAQAEREGSAPAVDQLKIDGGKSAPVGPFTEPGSYKLYCTIHPGMDLSVAVAG
jgi:plastocyanin